jgi:hypothetical protein
LQPLLVLAGVAVHPAARVGFAEVAALQAPLRGSFPWWAIRLFWPRVC